MGAGSQAARYGTFVPPSPNEKMHAPALMLASLSHISEHKLIMQAFSHSLAAETLARDVYSGQWHGKMFLPGGGIVPRFASSFGAFF
jgi:hypothetical protein